MTRLLLVATAITAVSILAGLVALEGSIGIVWGVLAAGFAWISVVGLARIRWNLALLRRHLDDMVTEVDHLDREDPQRSHLVIDLVETDQGTTGYTFFNQDFGMLQSASATGDFATAAPWIERLGNVARRGVIQVIATIFITAVFALLGLIFAVALAL